jgi:hypothetical protein
MADRDKHQRKTPPAGVVAQIAHPSVETWEDRASYTPTPPVPVDMPKIGEGVQERVVRQTSEIKNSSIDTLMRIDTLRMETNEKFEKVHIKIDEQGKKIDGHGQVLSDVRVLAERGDAQNKTIMMMQEHILEAQNTAKQQSGEIRIVRETTTAKIHEARALSQTEVDKASGLANIEAQKAAAAAKLEFWKGVGKQALVGLTAAGAMVGTFLAGRGC